MKPYPNLFWQNLTMQIGVHQRTYALVTLHLPSYFISISPILSLSELWWSTSTVNILSLILLVEGHLPFLFFIFLCSSTCMILLSFVFYRYQQCSCPNLGFPFGFLVFFNFLSHLCCFLLGFFFFFVLGRGGYLYVYFSSIAVEITILRCRIRVLVLGFECQNHKILVFY